MKIKVQRRLQCVLIIVIIGNILGVINAWLSDNDLKMVVMIGHACFIVIPSILLIDIHPKKIKHRKDLKEPTLND
jgi:ABC-type dipeptide/oligopeptide/nickel transport system permease subunit